MPPPPFQYSPLSKPDSFRVLHLQPSTDPEAQIHCILEEKCLGDYDHDILSPYTALSYVWGDASNPRLIDVDGQDLAITRNLHDALVYLRNANKVLTVWADAVCIDQRNILERNAQVVEMGRIYSYATHTIIFLDSSSSELDVVLRDLPVIAKNVSETVRTTEPFNSARDSFARIMSRPWFLRVWILQELVLSKDPFVQCGLSRVRWTVFCRYGNILREHERRINKSHYGGEQSAKDASPLSIVADGDWQEVSAPESPISDVYTLLNDMHRTRKNYNDEDSKPSRESNNTLSKLVISRRGYGATDPRDVIYAQLGLVSGSLANTTKLVVDYDKSIAKLYAEMTYFMISEGENTFKLLERRNVTPHHFNLPSWVPDWSKPDRPTPKIQSRTPEARDMIVGSNLVSLQQNMHALVLDVILVAEILQMGAAVGDGLGVPEICPSLHYFEPELNKHDLVHWVYDGIWPRPGLIGKLRDKTYFIDTGFRRMLHAWACSIGLPRKDLLPYDDILDIMKNFGHGPSFPLWYTQGLSERPFLLMALQYGFAKADQYSPLDYAFQAPPVTTDYFCTVKCIYPLDQKEDSYQILTVPETSRVGDIIANIDIWDSKNLVVIRPLKSSGMKREALPPLYEVVGFCHSNADIKGTSKLGEAPDKIALV